MDSASPTASLVLIRHGESRWNVENRFTGWTDVPLSEAGREEARRAGVYLREQGYRFDRSFVSQLQRAKATLDIVLRELGQEDLPVEESWRLNERHYGALEGLNKQEFGERYGFDALQHLRRGYLERPPPLPRDDPRHPCQREPFRHIDPALLPDGESLQDTRRRVMDYWEEAMAPCYARGEHLLVVAHGNTLRSLAMGLAELDEQRVQELEFPTGKPLFMEPTVEGSMLLRWAPWASPQT
jgi:2,3-bisphosphoglycerate-dependent phosphoglycerate mutase